jgi:hypothetical protein
LNLSYAGITDIPKEISKLKRLKGLSFESYSYIAEDELRNTISKLPEELSI